MGALDGRRIIVTGGSFGLGRAIAASCVLAGASVVCMARDLERLESACQATGAIPIQADVSDEESVHAAVQLAAEKLGGIDGLINNAGAMLHSRISQGRSADWRVVLDTNILAVLLMVSSCLPHIKAAGRGDIINVSSTAAVRPVVTPDFTVYSATKAAVNVISDGLRVELAPDGIRTVTVNLGLVAFTGYGLGIRDDTLRARVLATKDDLGMEASVVADVIRDVIALPEAVQINDFSIVPGARP